MEDLVVNSIKNATKLKKEEIEKLLEVPPNPKLGDYAFPCFTLSKKFKKNPVEISQDLVKKIPLEKNFEKIEPNGPYLNFFLNRKEIAKSILSEVQKKKDKFGSSKFGKGKRILIDLSSPNIAKPFGIGHLRSTIIGDSVSRISKFLGFKVTKVNYLGDWGTPFGKMIAGHKDFGDNKKLESDPTKYLYEIYKKVSKDKSYEEKGREWFKKIERKDKDALELWDKFRKLSLNEFNKIYSLLDVEFDVFSSESFYNNKMVPVIKELENKGLLEESQGAKIVNLVNNDLGVALIMKSDGTTLYATRDIAAALYRKKKYKFDRMFYEVGSEQNLYFKQLFKVLELMGYKWAKECAHINHGLYLDKDGKKFATRKGKTIFMEDILNETIDIARKNLEKRENLPKKELEKRAIAITRAAIKYGDLKNFRTNNIVFNIDKFLKFEGDTGPYLLYTYARARSILRKAKFRQGNKYALLNIEDMEKNLIVQMSKFNEVVEEAYSHLSPNLIANYAYDLAQKFNEFYHASQVIGDDREQFLLTLTDSFSQVLKNALSLLGIGVLEKM